MGQRILIEVNADDLARQNGAEVVAQAVVAAVDGHPQKYSDAAAQVKVLARYDFGALLSLEEFFVR